MKNTQIDPSTGDFLKSLVKQITPTLLNLAERWVDEHAYEDIADYGAVIEKILPFEVDMLQMHSNPFGFRFYIADNTGDPVHDYKLFVDLSRSKATIHVELLYGPENVPNRTESRTKQGKNYIDPTGDSTPEQLVYLNPYNHIKARAAAMKYHDEQNGVPMDHYTKKDVEEECAVTLHELGSDAPRFTGSTSYLLAQIQWREQQNAILLNESLTPKNLRRMAESM